MFELMKCDEKGSAERSTKKSRNDETKAKARLHVCVNAEKFFHS